MITDQENYWDICVAVRNLQEYMKHITLDINILFCPILPPMDIAVEIVVTKCVLLL
jgi:hypothetical protein